MRLLDQYCPARAGQAAFVASVSDVKHNDHDACMGDMIPHAAAYTLRARWKRCNERRPPLRSSASSVRGCPSDEAIVESGISKTTTDTTDFSDELVGVPAIERRGCGDRIGSCRSGATRTLSSLSNLNSLFFRLCHPHTAAHDAPQHGSRRRSVNHPLQADPLHLGRSGIAKEVELAYTPAQLNLPLTLLPLPLQ